MISRSSSFSKLFLPFPLTQLHIEKRCCCKTLAKMHRILGYIRGRKSFLSFVSCQMTPYCQYFATVMTLDVAFAAIFKPNSLKYTVAIQVYLRLLRWLGTVKKYLTNWSVQYLSTKLSRRLCKHYSTSFNLVF